MKSLRVLFLVVFFSLSQSCTNDDEMNTSLNSEMQLATLSKNAILCNVIVTNTDVIVEGSVTVQPNYSFHLEIRKNGFINGASQDTSWDSDVYEYYFTNKDTWLSGRVGDPSVPQNFRYYLPRTYSSVLSNIPDANNGPLLYLSDYAHYVSPPHSYSYRGFNDGHYSVVYLFWEGNMFNSNGLDGLPIKQFTIGNPPYALNLSTNGTGTVTKSNSWTSYFFNETETITARPGSGWYFKNWTGDTDGINPNQSTINITMTSNRSLTANFESILEITFNWPEELSKGQVGTYTATISGGSGIPTYTWYKSLRSGGTWGSWIELMGSDNSKQVTMGATSMKVKVVVTKGTQTKESIVTTFLSGQI